MALVNSLLTAMVRAGGDALVLHVGDRPYVVTATGPVDLSTQPLHLGAMTAMLLQLLPLEAQQALDALGAVEHHLPSVGEDRFTLVAARGGDDIWIEIRRRRGAARPKPAEGPVASEPRREPDDSRAPAAPEPDRAAHVATAPPAHSERAPGPAPLHLPAATPAEPPPVVPVAVPAVEPAPVSAVAAAASASKAEEVPDGDRLVVEATDVGAVALVGPPPAALPREAPAVPPAPEKIVPLTRTVRIEVPPRTTAPRIGAAERLLRLAAARGASSLLLSSGAPPYVRVDGDLRPLETEPPLTTTEVEAAILELGPTSSRPADSGSPAASVSPHEEWIVELDDVGRVRCVSFADYRGPGVVCHLVAMRAATAEQLGLPREVQALATEAEGLVVVAAPRGGGKSTLLSALVDLVNRQRAEYVITLERQIRLVHDRRQALVSQREIRGSADEALMAARAALREDPDVLVVDDLPLAPLVSLLVEAAGHGLLVFVSVTATSTAGALERLLDPVPPDVRPAVQAALAESFRGAVGQVLLKKATGGRIAAREVLLGNAAVSRLIADGPLSHLRAALESGRKHGMVALTDTLVQLVESATVDIREAYRKAPDRERLLAALKRQGIDTSVVERLA